MKIIEWIKDYIIGEEIDYDNELDEDYVEPQYRPCHNTLLYKYAERYITSLNPNHNYDVREELKSGMIVTHKENVTLREARDYVRMIWIESHPPNIIVEVTKTW